MGTVRNVACTVGVVMEIMGKRRSAKMARNGYISQFLHDLSGAQLPDVAVPNGSADSFDADSFGMQLHSLRRTFPAGSG